MAILYYLKDTDNNKVVGIDQASGGYPYYIDNGIPYFDTSRERLLSRCSDLKRMKLLTDTTELFEVKL